MGVKMTLKEQKRYCSRCGKYETCFPYDNSSTWLCKKCADKWGKIFQVKLSEIRDGIKRNLQWDREFAEFMSHGVGEPVKVTFT